MKQNKQKSFNLITNSQFKILFQYYNAIHQSIIYLLIWVNNLFQLKNSPFQLLLLISQSSIIIFQALIATLMKANLPINQAFENLKEYGSVSGSRVVINVNDGVDDEKETKDDKFLDNGFRQFVLLGQKKVERWQISFEKYFLAEHTATFKNQLQNFLEFALQNVPPQKQHSLTTIKTILFTPQSPYTIQDLLRKEKIGICDMHKNEFLKMMVQLQDLYNFLDHIIMHYHQILAKELIIISISIWIQFRNQDLKSLTRKELNSKSNNWLISNGHSYFDRDGFTYLNFKLIARHHQIPLSSVLSQFSKFIKYFSTTVLLILAGFFQNPYTKEHSNSSAHTNYPKRQLHSDCFDFLSDNSSFSDEEESFQMKKRLKQW